MFHFYSIQQWVVSPIMVVMCLCWQRLQGVTQYHNWTLPTNINNMDYSQGVLSRVEHSYWSRPSRYCALIGWDHRVASPALLCHKEPAQGTQSPLLGVLGHSFGTQLKSTQLKSTSSILLVGGSEIAWTSLALVLILLISDLFLLIISEAEQESGCPLHWVFL